MSNGIDRFTLGLMRAVERRRAKAQQHAKQVVPSVDDGAAITITQLDRDEQYRITTINNMLDFIKQKKEKMKNG